MFNENAFAAVINRRRSNRKFNPDIQVPQAVIKKALEHAILAPNSSNMQCWEFYWIHSVEEKKRFAAYCLNQGAAKSAQELVVFVTRGDQWKQRARWNKERVLEQVKGEPDKYQKRYLDYYGKLMPIAYSSDPFGIMGLLRRTISFIMGIRGPFVRMGGKSDQRVTVHKSCALAAENFMLSIAASDFDTCPMEGFDSKRIKKALGLPCGAEINMVIGVGKGTEKGVWGPRVRIPYEEVVKVL